MEILPELPLGVVRPPIQTATRVGVDRRRKFGQAQARPGKADQVHDAHPSVHIPDRFSREHAARTLITKLEPDLFLTVTGLTVTDFHLLVRP